MTEDVNVVVGEDEVSLLDIAGIDLANYDEYRLTVNPAGVYQFRILEAKLEAKEVTNKDDPSGSKIKKPAISFEFEAQNCFALTDDKLDPAGQIGVKHFENFYINDGAKDLGRVKAFLVDIGMTGTGALNDLLAQSQGIEFVCNLVNTKNKDNPDIVYANMKKPRTLEQFQADQAA